MEERFVLKGKSMRPFFKPGDILVMEPVLPEGVKRLQIVVFRKDGAEDPTAHRVIRVGKDDEGLFFVTKGDGVAREDPPVRPEEIEGRVVARVYKEKIRRISPFTEVATYHLARLYWWLRKVLRRPYYKIVDRLLPLLSVDFVLLKTSDGYMVKVVTLGRVLAYKLVNEEGEHFWVHPGISSPRRRLLRERADKILAKQKSHDDRVIAPRVV